MLKEENSKKGFKNFGNRMVFQALLCANFIFSYQLASFWNHKSEEDERSGSQQAMGASLLCKLSCRVGTDVVCYIQH